MANAAELLAQGKDIIRYGKLAEGRGLFEQALALDPANFDTRLELIRVALLDRDMDRAHGHIMEARKIDPDNPRLVALQGVWFLENLQFANAKQALEWAATKLEKDSDVHCNLSIVYRAMGDVGKAEIEARKSVELNPKSDVAHFELSKVLTMKGELGNAMLEVSESIAVNPFFLNAYVTLAQFFVAVKQIDEAIRVYQLGLQAFPELEFFHSQLALLYEQKQDFKGALASMEHAAKIHKTYPILLRVGVYAMLNKDVKRSEEAFLESIRLDPNAWDAYYDLGELYHVNGNLDGAEKYYREAITRVKDQDYRPYNGLGLLLINKRRALEAGEFLNHSLAIQPGAIEPTINMAVMYVSLQDSQKARDWALRGRELAQGNKHYVDKADMILAQVK